MGPGTRAASSVSRWPAILVAGLVLASCASTPTPPVSAGSGPPAAAALLEPQARTGEVPRPTLGPQGPRAATLGGVRFTTVTGLLADRPIFDGDFADPFTLNVDDTLYFYASDTTSANIPVILSGRATRFSGYYLGDALPRLPSWTVPGFQWGPAVWARPDGTFVLYYSTPYSAPSRSCLAAAHARHLSDLGCDLDWSRSSRQCISAATSTNPAGPFVDRSTAAFICPLSEGGAIDPSVFVTAGGTPYLLWKSDGNGYGLPTTIYSQPLAPDGLSVAGPPHALIGATQPWEGNLVEGPSMVEDAGRYWLFYSANGWDTTQYAIGLAACRSVTGPCATPIDHPWLASGGDDQGPGGEEFFGAFGLVWMVHHGWLPGQAGTPTGQRRLYLDLVDFSHGRPRLASAPLAAALAELGAAYDDPGVPHGVAASYLAVVHGDDGPLASDPAAQVRSDGATACAQLTGHVPLSTVIRHEEQQHLSNYQADVVIGAATEYVCPSEEASAMRQLSLGLNGS